MNREPVAGRDRDDMPGTPPEEAYAAFSRLAATLCDAPIAIVTLVDGAGARSRTTFGLAAPHVALVVRSFCDRPPTGTGLVEIEDAARDPALANDPLVTGPPAVRHYAGIALTDERGTLLGALCTLDVRARRLTDVQRDALERLAAPLVALVEARRSLSAADAEQAALVASTLEHAPYPMALLRVGTPTTFSYVNDAFVRFFGYAPGEIVGLRPSLLAGAKTDTEELARLRLAAHDGRPGEAVIYLYTASGEPRLVEILDHPLSATHRVFSIRDITEIHAAHEALVEANERLSSLLDNNSDAILTIDADGRCIAANPAAEALLGASRAHLLGRGFLDVVSDGLFPGQGLFPDSLRAGHTLAFAAIYRLRDGRTYHVACTAVPMIVDGETHGAYVLAKDVTEEARLADLVAERARRTHALYLISAAEGMTNAEQIDASLQLVLETFEMQYAFLGRIDGETFHLLNVVGQGLVEVGDHFPITKTRLQRTVEIGDVYAVDDISLPVNRIEGVPHYPGWHGYISAPLYIDDKMYGAIGFCSTKFLRFNDYDKDFVRLVAVLVACVIERQVQRARLDELAYEDALTGLANRARFMGDIEIAISAARRHGRSFALHFIDLDDFKIVNDRAGHAAGDLALKEVARRLRSMTRLHDKPVRLGGDEFVVLQPDIATNGDAESLGRRLVRGLCAPYELDGETFHVGASIGIAIYPDDGADARSLLQHADTALYRAKAAGKQRVEMTVQPG